MCVIKTIVCVCVIFEREKLLITDPNTVSFAASSGEDLVLRPNTLSL